MKARIESIYLLAVITVSMMFVSALPVAAADKYSSGSKNWDTTTANWGTVSGGPYNTAIWSDGDNAIFEGAGGGTVTLGEDISITHLSIATNDYTITGNTLIFEAGGTITNKGLMVTMECGISGAPNLYSAHPNGWGGSYGANGLFVSPTSRAMELGTWYTLVENYAVISGTTTGNTIVAMPKGGAYRNKMRWNGPGTWSVAGECYAGEFFINGGTLITGGRTYTDYRWITPVDGVTFIVNGMLEDLTFNGGTVGGTGIVQVAVNVPATGILAPGYPTGMMTITNNSCTNNGTLAISFSGDQCSRLLVDGVLDISAGTSTLDVNTVGASGKELIIAKFDSLTGSAFAATNNLPTSW